MNQVSSPAAELVAGVAGLPAAPRPSSGSGVARAAAEGSSTAPGEAFALLLALAGGGVGAVAPVDPPGLTAAGVPLRGAPATALPASSAELPLRFALPPGGSRLPQAGSPLPLRPGDEVAAALATASAAADATDRPSLPIAPAGADPSAAIGLPPALLRLEGLRERAPTVADERLDPLDVIPGLDARGSPSAARAADTPPAVALPASPVAQPAFDQLIGQRLLLMLQHGRQDARLTLSPEHLGSVEIHLNVDGDEARIALSSPHAVVRDALELALPRLREILADTGLALASADIGAGDSHSPQHPAPPPLRSPWRGGAAGDLAAAAIESVTALRIPAGLVDTFA